MKNRGNRETVPASFTAGAGAAQAREPEAASPNPEEVARLAYQYWEEGGRHEGTAEQNWLRAEEALRRRFGADI